MSAHTPGPWMIAPDADDSSAWVVNESEPPCEEVCAVAPKFETDIECANARLIAAAPTMLVALRQCWEESQDVCEMSAHEAREALIEIQQIAGAVIAKATGVQS